MTQQKSPLPYQEQQLLSECEKAWASDAKLSEEFGSFERYLAFTRAERAGKVKIFKSSGQG